MSCVRVVGSPWGQSPPISSQEKGMLSKKRLTEREIRNLESEIPAIAAGVTRAAYLRALAAGHTVIKVQGPR